MYWNWIKMSKVYIQSGKVLVQNNKVCAGDTCTCEGSVSCNDANPDQISQNDVSVSNANCDCDSGTHNGSYSFDSYFFGTWQWVGTTTCDQDPTATDLAADITITVECLGSSQWTVFVDTYELGYNSLYGQINTNDISVDGSNKFTGTVDIELKNFLGVTQCTITLTF